ncbi:MULTISPECIES: hypothetical protein [Pseudomonas]|uniref:Uncharacterized protein n=1 Tax=Pseudomonas juntendi TaxID=2666183 RepID=A0AAJ5S5I6_9PSED|nr:MULTISPECIES: hypothetical protein [Pseudomonas]MCK2109366.1 hypothetical protein [Pseudomonas juntendi]MCK2115047.1 hypothetical protein [Pseudomonas juntendi]MDG9807690.1 hypothetical protein [Pseudomonas juntendi]MDH1551119.1 hypothetical protein [Pseudomonas juntendi]WEA22410.1 hypothetical protein PWA60_09510 [Pseudomonas juntendi]
MLTSSEVIALSRGAHKDLKSWSLFVALTEFVWQNTTLVSNAARWASIWFEMEIVNALALAEWEEQGSPLAWHERWCEGYQADAQALLSELTCLIVTQAPTQ